MIWLFLYFPVFLLPLPRTLCTASFCSSSVRKYAVEGVTVEDMNRYIEVEDELDITDSEDLSFRYLM